MNLPELIAAKVELQTRRFFLKTSMACIGGMAFNAMLGRARGDEPVTGGGRVTLHHPARAKRVIYIHLAGGPSQLETFDPKPELAKLDGQRCPDSFLEGKRFAFIKGVPDMLGPQYKFARHGHSGTWFCEHLPNLAAMADDLCIVKSMWTEQFNHAPAQLMLQTGHQIKGRPSLGAWTFYGLGTENQDLPGFIVLTSGGKNPDAGKTVWGSGFLPGIYQGVQCQSHGEPILFAADPEGVTREQRRATLDAINELNQETAGEFGDPDTVTRMSQYELAFRMQMSVPGATDIASEPESIREAYGATPGKNTLANNILLARRLCERGVRFVQLYDWGWDAHGTNDLTDLNGAEQLRKMHGLDKTLAALLHDLKQRGLFDDTLVVCGAEFGRTPMKENRDGKQNPFAGRDHNPGAFSVLLAGGGAKPGVSYGETDDFGYQAVKDKVHVHDLNASILHLLGYDHLRLTYPFQGRHYRLTDVRGEVVKGIIT